MIKKSYQQMLEFKTFAERLEYLQTNSVVGEETFGCHRYLNQSFYRSSEWRQVRDYVISRDNGCDLGISDYEIGDRMIVHHINPVTLYDAENNTGFLLSPDNLVTTSSMTHDDIHFGNKDSIERHKPMKDRERGDTKLW